MLRENHFNLQKILWIFLAVTFPLFSVGLFRLNVGPYDITIPFLILVVIIVGCLFSFIFGMRSLDKKLFSTQYKYLALFCFLFLLVHLFSSLSASSISSALEEIIKLSFGILCFWGVIAFFPKSYRFMEIFYGLVLLASVVLIGYLLYNYIFIFNSKYLGIALEDGSGTGKNKLAWYCAIFIIYAFFNVFWKKMSFVSLMTLAIFLLALIYIGSRGAWISVSVGLLYGVFFHFRGNLFKRLKIGFLIFLVIPSVVVLLFMGLSYFIDSSQLMDRFIYLFHPQEIIRYDSYNIRLGLISASVEIFKTDPIFGIGITNYSNYLDKVTHNDFANVLLQLGMVGFLIYIGILFTIGSKIGLFQRQVKGPINWIFISKRCAFVTFITYLLFINIYTSVHFWIILGLIIVASELGKKIPTENVVLTKEIDSAPAGDVTLNKEVT